MGHAVPRMRARVVAVAIAGAIASLSVAADAQVQAPSRVRRVDHASPAYRHRYLPADTATHPAPASTPAVAPIMRTGSSSAEFGERQRDGHMTPDERRLLRQHIEDAVRELYKR